jgi:hypothetical protein
MITHEVFETLPHEDAVPEGAKMIMMSTWAMKKKANGVHHARLNAHGWIRTS